jgi:hypothetical protein
MGAEFRFDKVHHLPQRLTQGGIVVSHFSEITARVVLCPELISQAIRKVLSTRRIAHP